MTEVQKIGNPTRENNTNPNTFEDLLRIDVNFDTLITADSDSLETTGVWIHVALNAFKISDKANSTPIINIKKGEAGVPELDTLAARKINLNCGKGLSFREAEN